ncbi:VCBS repeat-containing protein [Nostoc sp. CHAB 5715]|uniref:FG-GAP repeat domain-containing protein n=1 Tax=Nostoc sp. CHAB 5715 TaxID=2780400 RepID=UPI001E545BCC|nr:VCBS repeat-containing protein [Nostoc sp. CHAB 5715]MCC5623166.1 VCBS repeat-containing protein [Nostoc sp. CHAB 5715]
MNMKPWISFLASLLIFPVFLSESPAYAQQKVGNGWNSTHYFPADWTGDGIPDLIVRNSNGDLILYPFKNGTFYNGGGPIQVGNGWNSTHYFPVDWTGDGIPDLIVRNSNGDLILYPFKNGTFYH